MQLSFLSTTFLLPLNIYFRQIERVSLYQLNAALILVSVVFFVPFIGYDIFFSSIKNIRAYGMSHMKYALRCPITITGKRSFIFTL